MSSPSSVNPALQLVEQDGTAGVHGIVCDKRITLVTARPPQLEAGHA